MILVTEDTLVPLPLTKGARMNVTEVHYALRCIETDLPL